MVPFSRLLKWPAALAVVAALLAGSAGAQGPRKPARDPLPRARKLAWDVRVLEESPYFKVIRREVKGGRVLWLLENTQNIPFATLYGFTAEFIDADGVTFRRYELQHSIVSFNFKAGERNRIWMNLVNPDDLRHAARVVIKRTLG
jgi:hypothetical protein